MSVSRLESRLRKLFNVPRKGETFEFREGLVSQYADERKDTIQRVIAAMTVGKDVSSLFPDILKNIATHDLEQKKLVYLYLMNYAKTNPELCILAVNTFVQDTEDPNPLVRALAIRTMGCIRVDKMVDYMEIPLKRTLKDDNPYVRKTAAICVAKLFDLNSRMCVEQGFLDELMSLLDDSNQMVVANSISALIEISKATNSNILKIDSKILKKLLMTLNECTEWGRIAILTALADYAAEEVGEVQHIIDRVSPQLQHENPAVVLSAVKVIIKQLDKVDEEQKNSLLKRLSSPLVSLLSTPPELQYVALRNIRIILEKYPVVLARELRVFFIKYNDPLYLKLEKIDIMVRLADDSNALLLLAELREYAMEIETEVVDKSVMALGQLAIKIPKISKKAIDVLYELFISRSEYVIDQLVVVLQNILRRYSNEYLTTVITIIGDLELDSLKSSDALASYVWIVGQYASEIPHLEDRLTSLMAQFQDMDPAVQSAFLTTIVKINLTKPTPVTQSLLQQALNQATKEIENPDVRDKAYIYWRILSTENSELQKKIILNKLPVLESTIDHFPPLLLNELVNEISNLGSVYHKPASSFIKSVDGELINTQLQTKKFEELQQMAKSEIVNNTVKAENLLDFDDDYDAAQNANGQSGSSTPVTGNILDELNDLFTNLSTQAPLAQPSGSSVFKDLIQEPESHQQSQQSDRHQKTSNADLLDLF
ncbi:hypothetical protein KL918_003380 [Ogataea parapolymorpha]|uniref:AP complex subunit beta n=1 Tax=Ogataea parapolymorpha (strain ATCC 26012 / BCRC 20466 / JCM 22074 / NRRL Y-7560 / DL-1) TaxID=871575 RepID=W1Q6T0_OGAPD|nr:Beta-adaptin, large subunit of the clathrin-associated protein (AP-1) complex [Ogataea parapolymorpha DL-1]ESW95824.1 Beta-adaptin, large subunit of the clathrin-associated protein (AP-1) complex [Ogataea parapolymorpha DL-1]KAG7866483.1 hypothetical protein KL918_003380 [Ogataea parapolymorpha]KAG7872581.1 hypothetical protein KL916_002976 [Ogataea parapolymorpha]